MIASARAVLLFLLTFAAYLTTLTQVHTFDALSYVTSVERKPWTEVFHPHHLAYGPLGVLALHAGRALGYTGGAALPMQVVNALAGALGVALFYAIVRRVTRRDDLALTSALLLGERVRLLVLRGRNRSLHRRHTVSDYLPGYSDAAGLVALAAQLASAWAGAGRRGAVSSDERAAVRADCRLVIAVCIRRRRNSTIARAGRRTEVEGRQSKGGWWSVVGGRWSIYAMTLGLAVALPYLLVGIGVSGFRSWAAFDAWLTEYARTGWWGGPITAQKWAGLATGLADTLAQPGGALLGLLLLGLLIAHLRALLAGPRPLVVALATWLLVYGAFFLWWEPDNIEFWIASLPPALLLLALALRGERRWGPGVWLALAVAVAAAGINYGAITRRGDPATDLQRLVARELAARSQPADLLLVPDGLLELYLPYYEQHDNFLSLNQALFDNDDDWDRACAAVRERIDTALHAGATVYLSDETLRPPALLLDRHHLQPAQITACFAPYGSALQFVPMPRSVPAYWRLAMGQERAEGRGWRFDSFAEGWQAANVQQELFAQGWHFVPGSDPALTSPLLEIDAADFAAIEIRMANGTAAHDAQLFFAGPDGAISEARSARWTLTARPGGGDLPDRAGRAAGLAGADHAAAA